MSFVQDALSDFAKGWKSRRVWLALASEDIDDQYRRTSLGPLWMLLNYLAFACTFIFVFHRGNAGQDQASYAAYVAVGLWIWFYIMELINQSIGLFVKEQGFIKGTTLPLSVYVFRQTMQSVIRLGYGFVGCVLILALTGTYPDWTWLWSAAGLLLIFAMTPAVITIFAMLGAYVPDSQFVIANAMRIGMFLTPVFWSLDGSRGVRHFFYHYNPFSYVLELVRTPVMTGELPGRAWLIVGLLAILSWSLATVLLGSLRRRLVFVL